MNQILLEVSRDLVANLALDELLPMILDQLARVVSYASSSIMLLEGDLLRPVAQRTAFLRVMPNQWWFRCKCCGMCRR